MANETGHCVNEAHFCTTVDYCVAKDTAYNPALDVIKLVNLQAKKGSIRGAMKEHGLKAAAWGRCVNEREAVYEPVNKLMTRIRNAVIVSEVTQQLKDDVHGIVNEILGVRKSPKMEMTPEDPSIPTDKSIKQISAAQTGYDNKLGNVTRLYNVLSIEPKYIPNEDDIKVTAIADLISNMTDKNAAVSTALAPMKYAMDARNKELYEKDKGGNELISKVRTYFKAAYGSNCPEYHHLAKLKVVKLAK